MIAGLGLWYSASDPAYDAFTYEQAIPTLFDSSGNGWDAAQATGSNQARFLTHDGRNYLRCPGVAGNDASTTKYIPGSGVFRVESNLRFVDYTPGIRSNIAGVFTTDGSQRSWEFSLNTTGRLAFTGRPDGTGVGGISLSSTVIVPDQTDYVAVECDFSAGTLNFYTSANGVSWTLLGTQQTFTPFTVFDSSALLRVGSVDAGTLLLLQAQVYWVKIYYNGAMVRYFDPSRGNFNSATIGSSTGETWTINRTGLDPAMIVSARAFLPLTDDYYDISASAADVLRNVSGGTMIAARARSSAAGAMAIAALSTATAAQTRMVLSTSTTSLVVGGRRLDADSFVNNAATTQQAAYEFALHGGRLNYAAALSANFKNGTLVGSQSAFQTAGSTSNTASARMRVFADLVDSPASFQSGPVTDLCLYNRAVPDAQIFGLSRYFAGRTGGAVTV
jgi:hypothetical protein